MTEMPIGEISRRSQVKVPTIRYYEQIGLLPPPPRSEGNRRLYGMRDLRRLSFIRHARDLGFEIDAIRTLLTLQDNPSQPCGEADGIVVVHLDRLSRSVVDFGNMLERAKRRRWKIVVLAMDHVAQLGSDLVVVHALDV